MKQPTGAPVKVCMTIWILDPCPALPQEVVYPDLAALTSALRQMSHQHRGLVGNQNPRVGAVLPSGWGRLLPLLFCVHQESLGRSEIL